MAEVFRARLDGPMGFKKTLAIKRIRDSLVRQDEEHVRSLINEARIGGKLRHPNIVEVYDLGEDAGAYYIAMEFVEGVNLTRLMEVAREHRVLLPPAVVLDIGIQICRGLSYAHSTRGDEGEPLDLVHRDLKPSNVMISLAGQAKLMDFGIAKASSNLFDTTATGIAKGTPLYMSPEQLRGIRPLKPASDLFSLGVLLYEMTSGKLLFAGRTIPEIITRVLNQPLDDAIDAADARIPGLGPVLKRLLDRDLAARYQEASDVRLELEHLLEWQDRDVSTAEVAQAVIKGNFPGASRMSTTAAALRPIVDREDASDLPRGTNGDPEHLVGRAGETLVGTWMKRQRRRRFLLVLLLGVALGIGAAVATYVFKGTLGVTLRIDSAHEALNSGDLEGALALWQQALTENPGRVDARFGAATLLTWAGEDPEKVQRMLEYAPEDTPAEFSRKYLGFARVLRAAGEHKEAFRYAKLSLDAARRANTEDGVPLPPALLQEAAEIALILDSPDAARSYFDELSSSQPAGALSDLADAWADAIREDRAALLARELLYVEGRRDEAYEGLRKAVQSAGGSQERLQAERLLWAYRALADERFTLAGELLDDLGALSGERQRRLAATTARAASLAGRGEVSSAKRELRQALSLTDTPKDRATARLQVGLALLRGGHDDAYVGSLLEEAALEVGDNDPDLQHVLTLRDTGAPQQESRFARVLRLGVEPRSGRFVDSELSRGGPNGTPLLPARDYARENLSRDGLAAPFGPTFHPIDGTLLEWVYHPGR